MSTEGIVRTLIELRALARDEEERRCALSDEWDAEAVELIQSDASEGKLMSRRSELGFLTQQRLILMASLDEMLRVVGGSICCDAGNVSFSWSENPSDWSAASTEDRARGIEICQAFWKACDSLPKAL